MSDEILQEILDQVQGFLEKLIDENLALFILNLINLFFKAFLKTFFVYF